MARRKRAVSKNYVEMGYHVKGPRGMSRGAVYSAIAQAIASGTGQLPPGVRVTWEWRNSPKKAMKSDPLAKTVRESRAGFLRLMLNRISHDAAGLPDYQEPAIREASEEEQEEFDFEHEELEEERTAAASKPSKPATRKTAARKPTTSRRAAPKGKK
jgi:hypothetical protein